MPQKACCRMLAGQLRDQILTRGAMDLKLALIGLE